MKRNQESRFALAPLINHPRSRFDRSHSLKSSGLFGQIIPTRVAEVYPGDTLKLKATALLRLVTPVNPTMDDAFADTYFFYVPMRLVWYYFTSFLAGKESNASYGYHTGQVTEYEADAKGDLVLPVVQKLDATDTKVGSLYDYMGIPIGYNYTNTDKDREEFGINALPFCAYNLIYNEWFRSELSPLVQCCLTLKDSKPAANTFVIRKACRFMDYFSVLTPSPQKGASVVLPVGDSAPVTSDIGQYAPVEIFDDNGKAMQFSPTDDSDWTQLYQIALGANDPATKTGYLTANSKLLKYAGGLVGKADIDAIEPYADLTQAAGITVLQFRLLVQTQKLLERLSLGSRYEEIIYNFFGVRPGDYRVQRPEYLGGYRTHLSMSSIAQTAQDNGADATPLGTLAGHSATAIKGGTFIKSFSEYGYLIGVMVLRVHHTYSQGLNKLFTRRNRLDLYNPLFQNVGNVPVYLKEIYAQGATGGAADNTVFGYGEYAGDLRFEPSRVTGFMRPNVPGGLPTWTYADKYDSQPYLGTTWLEESPENVDRTLAISALGDTGTGIQFIFDMYFKETWTRPMPVYSMPGLVDHH